MAHYIRNTALAKPSFRKRILSLFPDERVLEIIILILAMLLCSALFFIPDIIEAILIYTEREIPYLYPILGIVLALVCVYFVVAFAFLFGLSSIMMMSEMLRTREADWNSVFDFIFAVIMAAMFLGVLFVMAQAFIGF